MNRKNFKSYDVTPPVGAIIAFAGSIENENTSPPSKSIDESGWMICDGSELKIAMYPELSRALGNLYGGTESTFFLPDLRGQFLRGIGTDSASNEQRKAAVNGTADGVGSTQQDALQIHQHQYSEPTGASPGDSGSAFAAINPNANTSDPITSTTVNSPSVKVSDFETRPTNFFVYYIIKYTNKLTYFKHSPIKS